MSSFNQFTSTLRFNLAVATEAGLTAVVRAEIMLDRGGIILGDAGWGSLRRCITTSESHFGREAISCEATAIYRSISDSSGNSVASWIIGSSTIGCFTRSSSLMSPLARVSACLLL